MSKEILTFGNIETEKTHFTKNVNFLKKTKQNI